jgi:hypothetical protein
MWLAIGAPDLMQRLPGLPGFSRIEHFRISPTRIVMFEKTCFSEPSHFLAWRPITGSVWLEELTSGAKLEIKGGGQWEHTTSAKLIVFFYSFLLSSFQWWFWLGTPHVTVVTSFPSLSIE